LQNCATKLPNAIVIQSVAIIHRSGMLALR
jgi:hypothetical protein